MKKLNFAIQFLKFLPLPSLHSFMLTKAVEHNDPISVERLLTSRVVDRLSDLDQSVALMVALKSLLNGQHKEIEDRNNARSICHMLLDRGIGFRGIYERNIIAHSSFLSARVEDHSVLLKMFHADMAEHTKIDTFAHIVLHMSDTNDPVVGQLYELWSDVLKGPVEVSRLGWTRVRSDTREGAPSLMEWCLWRAPEKIVLNLINDCIHIDAEECRDVLQRSPLNCDVLDALVNKGVDLQRLVKICDRTSRQDAIEYIQAYQQRSVLEQAIETPEQKSELKRKM